ncbi:hypothetical protein HDU77_007768 [Chytriomyces hyalinus]|nr:hypothetical protein HDU77_007768 [Chytriomyces hyalinus]
MRADVTDADMAAFYIAAVMLAVMTIALLLLITVVFRSTNQRMASQSSTGGQSKVYKTRPTFMHIFTVFNASLLGMVLGLSVMFSSLLLFLPQSHTYKTVRGGVLLESVGGTLFESSYCIYTWYRSKSLIGKRGGVLYWILTVLAVLSPILFIAQLITGALFESQLAGIQIYPQIAVAAAAGMFVLDVGLLSCFVNFLLKNPAPTSSTGHFNGNSEAQKQWNRTSIIAKYGAFSCALSFLALAIIAANALFLSLNTHVNLVTACGYSVAGLNAIILLVMKIKLEGGSWKLLFGSTVKSEEFGKTNDQES